MRLPIAFGIVAIPTVPAGVAAASATVAIIATSQVTHIAASSAMSLFRHRHPQPLMLSSFVGEQLRL